MEGRFCFFFLVEIELGCYSGACDKLTCTEKYFCHDVKWRLGVCLRRRCIEERPCMNGATCEDSAENGVSLYKCVCRPQFQGDRCETGSLIARPQAGPDTINVTLVVGKYRIN